MLKSVYVAVFCLVAICDIASGSEIRVRLLDGKTPINVDSVQLSVVTAQGRGRYHTMKRVANGKYFLNSLNVKPGDTLRLRLRAEDGSILFKKQGSVDQKRIDQGFDIKLTKKEIEALTLSTPSLRIFLEYSIVNGERVGTVRVVRLTKYTASPVPVSKFIPLPSEPYCHEVFHLPPCGCFAPPVCCPW